jgi:signal transduction histidine kinase
MGNNLAQAADNRIDEQLLEIKAKTDNQEAISQLANIINSPQVTTKQYILAVNMQAERHINLDNFVKAISLLQQAQLISQEQELYQLEAATNKLMGIVYYYQGNSPKSLVAYQMSLSFYQSIDAPLKEANLLNNIALVYSAMSNYSLALKNYTLAEPIYQAFGSEEDKLDLRYNIALMYVNLRRYDKAITMLHEVVLHRKSINDDLGLAMAWADLGNSYKHAGQYQQAKNYLLDALSYFKSHNNRHHIASQLHNISEVYLELEDYRQAKKYAERGVNVSLAIGHQKAYAGNLNTLAKAYFHQGDIKKALDTIMLSNDVARESNYKALLNDNLALIALIYATQNNTAEALSALLSHKNTRKKIQNDLFNEQLVSLESEQLIQQVDQLVQNKELQVLKSEKKEQLQYFITFSVLTFLLFILFTTRGKVEKNVKQALEGQVKQRTQKLEFLIAELRRANKIKSQFLTNMSSDIKTPLTKVIEQSNLILNDNTKELDKGVAIILDDSLHLLALINNILDLTKIEANTLELDLQEQDLTLILTNITELYSEQSNNKGLSFELHSSLTTPFITNIDALRLKQVLIIFCSNALKFTHKGKIRLTVSLSNNELMFSVMDTGVGMNKVKLKQIFDSFNQGDSSPNRHLGSAGLGLFIAEQLAAIMGGHISAKSILSQGTTFTFTLPIMPIIDIQ